MGVLEIKNNASNSKTHAPPMSVGPETHWCATAPIAARYDATPGTESIYPYSLRAVWS